MSLVLCHYHLQPGGVTRIIQSQVEALRKIGFPSRLKLICGYKPDSLRIPGLAESDIIVKEAFDYLSEGVSAETCFTLSEALSSTLTGLLGREDILHMHNPNLGKNPVLTLVLYRLAKEGYRLFYHCHDFSEDRKRNYDFNRRVINGYFSENLNRVLYPDSRSCLFGVLNSRDFERLREMGIDEKRIRYVPNPVSLQPVSENHDTTEIRKRICKSLGIPAGRIIFLYPVRVIKRKNIGEFILLASLFNSKASWLVTLAPHNPAEIREYVKWKEFAKSEKIPVLFDVGHEQDFLELISAADRVITTSTQEGFGMTFLEPWLLGKPVVGRNIPYVIGDFEAQGIVFDSLYDRLPVSVGEREIDFATLGLSEQMAFIRKVNRHKSIQENFLKAARIDEILFRDIPRKTIENNKRIISTKYSLLGYGKRLSAIYQDLSRES